MKKMICASHKFTISDERNGEMAARLLSDKAHEVYEQTDPMTIYEYRDADNNKLYAYNMSYNKADIVDNLSFEELEHDLEVIYDEYYQEEEDEEY